MSALPARGGRKAEPLKFDGKANLLLAQRREETEKRLKENNEAKAEAKRREEQLKLPFKVERRVSEKLEFSWKEHFTLEKSRSIVAKILYKFDDDEACIQAHISLVRFQQVSNRSGRRRAAATPLPDRTEREQQRHFVTQELNKLSMNNFNQVLDNVTKNPAFESTSFLELLSDGLFDAAIVQPLFSDLYSFFAHAVTQVLNNDEFRLIARHFVDRLRNRVVQLFTETDFSIKPDVYLGHASFLGCLAARPPLVDLDVVFRGAVQLLQDPISAIKAEICGKLVIPCGRLIDAKYGELADTSIFQKLKTLSSDRSLPGSVRYFLIDILQARAKGWDTHALLNQIHNLTTAKPVAPVRRPVKAPAKEPTPRISAGQNMFAGLESDSEDEYAAEEEEALEESFDALTMIKEFLVDKTIAKSWRREYLDQLMITVAQFSDLARAVRIFRTLHEADVLDASRIVEQLRVVVAECMRPEIRRDCPTAVAGCGAILARFVELNAASPNDFDAIFPVFDLGAVGNFLDQIVETKKIANLRESGYWMDCKWRPEEGVRHIEIAKRINEHIIELFPVYDSLIGLELMFADNATIDEIMEEIQQIPEDVVGSTSFALGIVELLLRDPSDRSGWEQLLGPISGKATEILSFAEFYGLQNNWQPNQVGAALGGLLSAGTLDPTGYRNRTDLGPRHAEIVRELA
jgi:hypothetical protein